MGGRGQLPFETFQKIHPIWWRDPSLRLLWLLERSSKCVLFWYFSIQFVKKAYPEPWICYFVSISCSKSPALSYQNLQHKFLDWKWPWHFSENSPDLVAGPFPYLCLVDHLSQEDPRHLFNNNFAIAEPEKRLCCTPAQVKTSQVILEMFQMTCVAPLVQWDVARKPILVVPSNLDRFDKIGG